MDSSESKKQFICCHWKAQGNEMCSVWWNQHNLRSYWNAQEKQENPITADFYVVELGNLAPHWSFQFCWYSCLVHLG